MSIQFKSINAFSPKANSVFDSYSLFYLYVLKASHPILHRHTNEFSFFTFCRFCLYRDHSVHILQPTTMKKARNTEQSLYAEDLQPRGMYKI